MDEFSLIERYFAQPAHQAASARLGMGIGDDCALVTPPANSDLVFSIDTMVEAVHFPVGANPGEIAWRLLGAAVSDLAAMGATPHHFTLALTLPERNEAWLADFSSQLFLAAKRYDIVLAGGDTTRGPLTLSVQAQGFVPRGEALLRSGAKVGDRIFVSGDLGDSRAGLSLLDQQDPDPVSDYLIERYYRPTPRLQTGLFIRQFSSACIDISDGLLADLSHLLTRSKVGAKIDSAALPISAQLAQYAPDQALDWALSGGEDFELCFTVPAARVAVFEQALAEHSVKLSQIGEIVSDRSIQLHREGVWQAVQAKGYNHFAQVSK